MKSFQSKLRHEWKKYIVAAWMILMTGFFLNVKLRVNELISRMNAIESKRTSATSA